MEDNEEKRPYQMPRLYLANGLFSEADQLYNESLAESIRSISPDIELYVPQENKEINDKTKVASSIPIFDGDTSRLADTDILVVVLDGPTLDAGVAAEIGYFASICEDYDLTLLKNNRNHPYIFGLYTDCRDGTHTPKGEALNKKAELLNTSLCESQFPYINLYVIGAIKKYGQIFSNKEDLVSAIKKVIN